MTRSMPLWTIKGPRFGSMKWLSVVCLVATLSVSLVLLGCSFSSFVQAAEADLPTILQIIVNIVQVIAPAAAIAPQIQNDGNIAIQALQVLCGTPASGATKCDPTSLVGQYQATPSVGTLQKIEAALQTVNSHVAAMLQTASSAITIPMNVSNDIVIAIGVALTSLTAIMSLIPPSPSAAAIRATVAHAVKPDKPAALKAKYNAAVAVNWPAAVIN